LSNTTVPCRQCGYPTTGALGEPDICPLCAADNLKGGPMVCKKCHKACQPIGATLRGVQLVACPSCGHVYTPDLMKLPPGMPAISITRVVKKPAKITSKKSVVRGGQTVSHGPHKAGKVRSIRTPATKKTNQSTKNHKTVVKKRKIKAGKHA